MRTLLTALRRNTPLRPGMCGSWPPASSPVVTGPGPRQQLTAGDFP
ncbi:MAG TPA: hypothetical protein VGQ69_02160 [Gemmatimonadales bacterium]|nr:hypothetical protein [Gemmatimonadales bacterium]